MRATARQAQFGPSLLTRDGPSGQPRRFSVARPGMPGGRAPERVRSSRDAALQQQVAQMSTRNPRSPARNIGRLLASRQVGTTSVSYQPFTTIFAQGDPCAVVMYIEKGRVKLMVTSQAGQQAVVGILGAGAFFGEGALAGPRRRTPTAETMTARRILLGTPAQMRPRLPQGT